MRAMTEARLAGRSVLVTGAGSGIGRALAELAVASGADATLVDVDGASVAGLAPAGRGRACAMDVADAAAWERLPRPERGWDFVALNAGVMTAPPDAPREATHLLTMDLARYERVMRVNVDGAAATALKRLNEAYGVLGRPERRRKYDEVFLARQKELELKAARAAFRRTAMMQWFVIGALGAVLVTQGIFLAYIGRDEISSFLSSIGF